MRAQYVILLGLILFQGVFIAFSSAFPYTGIQDTITEGEYDQYNVTKSGDFGGMLFDLFINWGAGGLIAIAGIGIAIASKNYVFIGVGLFLGIISTLYLQTWQLIAAVNITENVMITSIVGVLAIAIGIIALFSLVDMFAPQGARQ